MCTSQTHQVLHNYLLIFLTLHVIRYKVNIQYHTNHIILSLTRLAYKNFEQIMTKHLFHLMHYNTKKIMLSLIVVNATKKKVLKCLESVKKWFGMAVPHNYTNIHGDFKYHLCIYHMYA